MNAVLVMETGICFGASEDTHFAFAAVDEWWGLNCCVLIETSCVLIYCFMACTMFILLLYFSVSSIIFSLNKLKVI